MSSIFKLYLTFLLNKKSLQDFVLLIKIYLIKNFFFKNIKILADLNLKSNNRNF